MPLPHPSGYRPRPQSKVDHRRVALAGLLFGFFAVLLMVLGHRAARSPGSSLKMIPADHVLVVMFGVGFLAIIFGVSTAWVVSRYHFPCRRLFDWLLVLPAAMPAYIIAYSYTDFLEYAGPFQTGLRQIFDWQTQKSSYFWKTI